MLRLARSEHFAEKRAGVVALHRTVGLQLGLQLALDLSLARPAHLHACLHFATRHDKQNPGAGKDFPRPVAARSAALSIWYRSKNSRHKSYEKTMPCQHP